MGYKMPIVCKELYLPCYTGNPISLDEYKKRSGIDLKEYIFLSDSGTIDFKIPDNTKIYIVAQGAIFYTDAIKGKVLSVTSVGIAESTYMSGSSDASIYVGLYDVDGSGPIGMRLMIHNYDDFNLDNLLISSIFEI